MHSGIIFALASMVFAGINDVVFKNYSRKDRSRGMYIFGIGIIWSILQLITFKLKGSHFHVDTPTILFGLMAGFFLAASNISLLESLTHLNVGLGSTIYRLNTVGVVILSFFFLNEPMEMIKLLGISCGIIGVFFLYSKQKPDDHRLQAFVFFSIAILASLLRAFYGVTIKAGILKGVDPLTMLLIIAPSWIVGGALYTVFREKRFVFTKKKIVYSLISGVLVYLIANFLMLSVEHGQASIVIPIANMSFVIALGLSIVLKMENLTYKKVLAILFAAGSIILLSQA